MSNRGVRNYRRIYSRGELTHWLWCNLGLDMVLCGEIVKFQRNLIMLLLLIHFPLNSGESPIVAVPNPKWATGVGEDQFGHWADVTIGGVIQRMRWIYPGTFVMGSPQEEKDAQIKAGIKAALINGRETQHSVTLTNGFWLADSSCTQALWQAMVGNNPSFFTVQHSRNQMV